MVQESGALEYYRRLVSLVYREVGSMCRQNHPELYNKSNIGKCNLGATRKDDAKKLYLESKDNEDIGQIERSYVQWFGLTLEEVNTVFDEGDGLLGGNRCWYGGPRWAKITHATLDLRNAILNNNPEQQSSLVQKIRMLKHNTGLIIEKFKELSS